MGRKRFGGAVLLLVMVAGGVGGVLWALSRVPDFYADALTELSEPEQREQAAKQFVERTVQLVQSVQHDEAWAKEFTQQQVNSWLAEELHQKHADLIPKGIRDPRIQFIPETVQLGFLCQRDGWEGVISVRVRPWVPDENQLALEIESVKAGLMPIPLDRVVQQIARHFETDGWQVEWRRADRNDVLVIHLDRGEPDQPVLQAVEVVEGAIRVSGQRGPRKEHADGDEPRVADQPDGRRSEVK